MTPRFGVAALGGTFDRLHVGHRALLDQALRSARKVGVGVTTDAYLAGQAKPLARRIQPFATRWRVVERYLKQRRSPDEWWLTPLDDLWGRSVEPGVEALVATPESARGAAAVNRERRRRGLPPLAVIEVPLALGEDLLPVSSRRIRAGKISREGRRRRPLSIAVVGAPVALRGPLAGAFATTFGAASHRLVFRRDSTGPRSRGERADRSAGARAAQAAAAAEYGVALVPLRARGQRPRPAATAWYLAVADAEGPVAPPMLVTPQSVPAAMRTTFAERRRQHAGGRPAGAGRPKPYFRRPG